MMKSTNVEAIKIATDTDLEVDHLSGMPSTVLEDGAHICDYQLVLQCRIKGDAGLDGDDWPCTLSLWCLNPSLVFKNIADASLSVILTSGTLSPMSSFQSELGVQFGTSLEAPHVINVESQLWAGVIHSGPGNYPLNASYKTSEGYGFQDALGSSLEEICKVVPGGCLVFFPSYKLMDKLRSRWSETGQWSRLNAQKPVFVESRGNQDDFEQVLSDYYNTIRQGSKPTVGRRRGKKVDAVCSKGNPKKGATFLAVCRGKVSEGIDFSDENARAVIIIGIPFPNVFDIQVAEKKRYNDTYKSSKSLLSGNEWYCQQAFRALNQAAGRCIRHRHDYGAIIFLDERFRQERNLTYISKWIRKSIRQYDNFDQSLDGLKSFFKDIKVENVAKQIVDVEAIDVEEPKNLFTQMMNQKISNLKPKGRRSKSDAVIAPPEVIPNKIKKFPTTTKKFHCPSPLTESKKPQEARAVKKGDNDTGIPYIDSKGDLETQNRFPSPTSSMNISHHDDFDLTIVKETPRNDDNALDHDHRPSVVKETPINNNYYTTVVESVSEVDLSESTIIQSKFPPHSVSSPCSTSASECTNATITPKKQQISHNNSPLDSSVNSHFHKRRKSSAFASVKMAHFDSPDPKTTFPVKQIMNLGDVAKNNLKISCSLCKNPLGLAENDYFVPCTTMSLSKVHLVSVWKGTAEGPTNVPVVVSDISSVDGGIWERSREGVWSKEDGCVFNTTFCPFCSDKDNCLGLHAVATDSSNVQFLNKVLFYSDRLEIQNIDASTTNKEQSPSSVTSLSKSVLQNPFEIFAYTSPETNSIGWRTTKSKMRLPKKVQVSTTKH